MTEETTSLLELATELTIAWLSNPNTRASPDDVPAFLERVHGALGGLTGQQAGGSESADTQKFTPAVSVRKSLSSKDHIISLIDGKPYKMLRRHLSTNGLTPEQYRERYNLRSDYPMVAANYTQTRRDLAKKIGLGRKPGQMPSGIGKTSTSETTATKSAAIKSAAPKRAVAKAAGKSTTAKSAAPKQARGYSPEQAAGTDTEG